jgi:hypothetical protein
VTGEADWFHWVGEKRRKRLEGNPFGITGVNCHRGLFIEHGGVGKFIEKNEGKSGEGCAF